MKVPGREGGGTTGEGGGGDEEDEGLFTPAMNNNFGHLTYCE
jgi:hypothetical protein